MNLLPERDPLLEAVLAARPDVEPAAVDPESPRALALRGRITAAEPSPVHEPIPALARRGRPGSHRRRLVVAAAAAAVLAVVATVSGGGLGLDGPTPAAASIEDVAAASQDMAQGSGRATVTYDEHWADGLAVTGEVAFSGGDVEMTLLRDGGRSGLPSQPSRESGYRIVDGKLYERHDGGPWIHNDLRDDNSNELPGFDPRTVLEVLQTGAGFTVVGDEELDGRPVRHLRAGHPEVLHDVLSDLDIGVWEVQPDQFEGLDVWVGLDDDVVYRLDFDVDRPGEAPVAFPIEPGEPCPDGSTPFGDQRIVDETGDEPVVQDGPRCRASDEPARVTGTYSIRFHDLGGPITVTSPPGSTEMTDTPG